MRVQLNGSNYNAAKGMTEWSLAQIDRNMGRTGTVLLIETEPNASGVFVMGRVYNVEMVEREADVFTDAEDTPAEIEAPSNDGPRRPIRR